MSRAPGGGTAPTDSTDFRPAFTRFMGQRETWNNANKVTHITVSKMNQRMAAEGIPMSQAHYQASTASMSRGDTTCGFLKAEHDHVMLSTGDGPVYNAGKAFHKNVVGPLKKMGGE